MKEAFEKIIERLEEEVKGWLDLVSVDETVAYAEISAYNNAIEIVNQVAEEYSSKSSSSENDWWIALPKVAFDRMIARMESESERDIYEEESLFINVRDAARIVREIVREYSNSEIPNMSEKVISSDDCCEWRYEKGFIRNPHTQRMFSNEPSMQNHYCNTCGKKLKVVE